MQNHASASSSASASRSAGSSRPGGASPVFGRHIWQLARFVKPYSARIAIGLAANGLARSFDLLPMVLAGRVVDAMTASQGGGAPMDPSIFWRYGLAVLGTFAGLALFQTVSDYALDTMAQKVRHDLRTTLYDHIQKLDIAYFENRQTGDIISVVSSDVDNLERFFADVSTSVIRLFITFFGIYSILLWLDWRLALLLFAPLPLAVFAIRFYATRVQPEYRRARQAVGQVNSLIENNLGGMGVIQAYTAEAFQAGRVGGESAGYRDAAIAASKERARFVPVMYIIAGASFASLIAVGGWLTFSGFGPSLGDYTTFLMLAMRLILPLFVFGMLFSQIQRSEASAQRIQELLATKPQVRNAPGAAAFTGRPARLEFRNVRFGYPDQPGEVIRGVDFELTQGKVLGVVGPTGAGKSTLVKLLLRYYDPTQGQILLDGQPLPGLTLESLRAHTGYVSQEAFLFFGTIRENIALGSPHATDKDIARAAAVAGADEFIDRLELGLDTLVGERGLKLSGGQRQRISLARAVLRDPALLILDEATSSVDVNTEEIIQTNLSRFRDGRMTLAVAHRLSTVRNADEILVFMHGQIAERGTHDGLLAKNGVYAGLWRVQSGEV